MDIRQAFIAAKALLWDIVTMPVTLARQEYESFRTEGALSVTKAKIAAATVQLAVYSVAAAPAFDAPQTAGAYVTSAVLGLLAGNLYAFGAAEIEKKRRPVWPRFAAVREAARHARA